MIVPQEIPIEDLEPKFIGSASCNDPKKIPGLKSCKLFLYEVSPLIFNLGWEDRRSYKISIPYQQFLFFLYPNTVLTDAYYMSFCHTQLTTKPFAFGDEAKQCFLPNTSTSSTICWYSALNPKTSKQPRTWLPDLIRMYYSSSFNNSDLTVLPPEICPLINWSNRTQEDPSFIFDITNEWQKVFIYHEVSKEFLENGKI